MRCGAERQWASTADLVYDRIRHVLYYGMLRGLYEQHMLNLTGLPPCGELRVHSQLAQLFCTVS